MLKMFFPAEAAKTSPQPAEDLRMQGDEHAENITQDEELLRPNEMMRQEQGQQPQQPQAIPEELQTSSGAIKQNRKNLSTKSYNNHHQGI